MAKYICNHAVGAGGRNYKTGEEIRLSPEEAAPLLKSGAVTRPPRMSAYRKLFGGGTVVIDPVGMEGDNV